MIKFYRVNNKKYGVILDKWHGAYVRGITWQVAVVPCYANGAPSLEFIYNGKFSDHSAALAMFKEKCKELRNEQIRID